MTSTLFETLPLSIPLGKKTAYPNRYDKGQLERVSRAKQREAMGLDPALPMHGADIWQAFEISWLNAKGLPTRALARITVPSCSPFIAESKSVKLYLNSVNGERFADISELLERIRADLSDICDAAVTVEPITSGLLAHTTFDYFNLDSLDVAISRYERDANLLDCSSGHGNDKVYTHAFKSHCLCTGQPDWGSIFIAYEGARIHRTSLLRYLISYHTHQGFSENCIEQIYADLMARANPQVLQVFGLFTRRGGIEINPYRSNVPLPLPHLRTIFQ